MSHKLKKTDMQWPPDVIEHIWEWTRILLRPGFKKRTWANVHTELRKKWLGVFFEPLCCGVAFMYNERDKIEEGGFELGGDYATFDAVRSTVAVLGIPSAWGIDGLFLDCGFGEIDDKEWRREALTGMDEINYPYEYIPENAAWMVECMNHCGLEASVSDLKKRPLF